MAQYFALRRGEIPAALNFLNTPALTNWLWQSRPAQAGTTLNLAHRLADVGQMMQDYASNPTGLRRAILSRRAENLVQKKVIGAIFDSNPSLGGHVNTWREAYCSWDTLGEQERQALITRGHTEAAWQTYELPSRVAILRKIWLDSLQHKLPKSVLDPQYASTLFAFLEHAGAYLSKDDYSFIKKDAEQAERLIARVAAARAQAALSNDEDSLRGLADVAQQKDVYAARIAFDRVFAGAGGTAVRLDMPPVVPDPILRALAARLPAAIRALAEGTPAETTLSEAERLKPLRLSFGKMRAGVGAIYSPESDMIVLSAEDIAEMLNSEGGRAEDLLTDSPIFKRFVLAVAPLFIHEATHARQYRLLARRGFSSLEAIHAQSLEVEAYAMQKAFARSLVAYFPEEVLKMIKAFSSRPELHGLISGWAALATDPVKYVPETYTSDFTDAGAWSDMFRTARSRHNNTRLAALSIAELARRKRLPAVERIRLEQNGSRHGAIRTVRTSVLRNGVSLTDNRSRAMTNAVTAACNEIADNAHKAMQVLLSLW